MMLQQQQGGGLNISGDDSSVAAAETREAGGGGSGSGGVNEEEKGRSEDSERNSGGSRWPRQETIALLKIRSDMDVAFRDSSLKAPLWDEVSRKLSELGYHRSAKKCKEKFENVYKYHKRTKDGRNTKADGKNYRFFEQLEALDTHPSLSLMSSSGTRHPAAVLAPAATLVANNNITTHMNMSVTNATVSSTPSPISTVFPSNALPHINLSSHNIPSHPTVTISPTIPTQKPIGSQPNLPPSYSTHHHHNPNMSFLSNSTSSTSSDEQPAAEIYGKRKRKWEDFFGRLMNEVIQKQDELQKRFLDTLEKRERDRVAREEAWRVQEMARMNQEHELLLQERSMAAAKDSAVISFLQKITEQQLKNSTNNPITMPPLLNQIQAQVQEIRSPPSVPPPQPPQAPPPAAPQAIVTAPAPAAPAPAPIKIKDDINSHMSNNYNGGSDINATSLMSPSPSRWPKAEVHALIKLRSTLDTKYNENGPKGPLWEDISAAMRKMGYNRNAKRCKEKWENINKYYKKVKESNKKRPEDAKTCPYFHQLDALYKEKAIASNINNNSLNSNPGFGMKAVENNNPMATSTMPIMAQPERQWPQESQQHHKNNDQDNETDHNLDDPNMNEDDYEDDEDEDDDGAAYEIVTNKQQQQQQQQQQQTVE